MISVVRAGVTALAFFVAGTGAAIAEGELPPCPESTDDQLNAVRYYYEQTEGPINEAAVNDANILEAVCADRFITMYQLADTWFLLLSRSDLSLEEQGTIANRALDILIKADAAPAVPHDYERAREIRERIVDAAVLYADAGGPPGPFFTEDGTFAACSMSWWNVSQNLWYAYRDEWTGSARPNFIANLSRSCADKQGSPVHKWYGELRVEQARQASDPAEALALMEDARAAYLVYTGDDHEGLDWGLEQQQAFDAEYRLMKFHALAGETRLPREAWFTPENLESGDTYIAIALAANDIWGPHYTFKDNVATKDEFAVQIRAYREFVQSLHDEAVAAGPPARQVLFESLRDHATGKLRTAETKDYLFQVDSLWSWTDPGTLMPGTSQEQ